MSGAVLITRQSLANEAAERWRGVYGSSGRRYGVDKQRILRQLQALGETPNPDDVDEAIGNGSWTQTPQCDGCGAEDEPAIVRVGDEPDYDSQTAHLCRACILAAARIAGAAP